MRITRTLAAALAIAALAAPVAMAQPADMHASTAAAAAKEQQKQDLRSPDTRDAAAAVTRQQDLRSPDARDAAIHLHRSGLTVGTTEPVTAKVVPAAKTADDGTDWTSIALGIGLSLLAVACIGLMATRRHVPPLRPSA